MSFFNLESLVEVGSPYFWSLWFAISSHANSMSFINFEKMQVPILVYLSLDLVNFRYLFFGSPQFNVVKALFPHPLRLENLCL